MLRITPAVTFLLATMVSNVFGATIYGTAAPVGFGSRTEGAQIITGGSYASDGQTFTVSWDISFNPGTSIYSYAYTFSGFTAPDISHFTLDLTDNCTDTANQGQCVFNLSSSAGIGSEFNTFGTHPSNPGFPLGSSITGVKFNVGSGSAPLTFSFDSFRAPMWGDIYFKGGSDSFAYNAGLENHSLESTNAFVAVVDTVGAPIPEPTSLLSLGSGLILIGFLVRRRLHVHAEQ
jgi:hypothetical protein